MGSTAPFVGMIHKFQKKKKAPLEIEDKQEFTFFVLKRKPKFCTIAGVGTKSVFLFFANSQ